VLLDSLLKASLFRSDSLELFLLYLSRQVLLRVSNRRVGRVRKLYFLHFLLDGLFVHHRLEFVECLALQLSEVIGLEHELFLAGIVLDQVLVAGVLGVEDRALGQVYVALELADQIGVGLSSPQRARDMLGAAYRLQLGLRAVVLRTQL